MSGAEMLRYNASPRMGIGSVGKRGLVRLEFERDGERTVLRHLERRAPLIVQQALYFDPVWAELPCVYVLSSGGPNVDGDRYEQHFAVGRDAFAHISTGAATKIASMQYNYSALHQTLRLDSGAYLEYLPEPVIPCRGSRYRVQTLITISPTATLLYAEVYLCGRRHSGERFDYDILSVGVRAEREDGSPLFADKMIVRPQSNAPSRCGVMGEYEVLANVLVLTPESHIEQIYSAQAPLCGGDVVAAATMLPNRCGLIYRVLGHESQMVKRRVREFCSVVRHEVKGRVLADDFPWR